MDEADDATPFVSQVEVEINEILGLFDVPAFARRGQELEYALSRLHERVAREREVMLEMLRLRFRQWGSVATGPDDWSDTFSEPIAGLWVLAGADSPTWSKAAAPLKRRRAVARDLVASVERFNGAGTRSSMASISL